ncbi:unnamed protein product [Paramecium sonneborni]|uniref:Uncharacterized protein n=1 Tax=Paramecium sonneborni TaxID=65129 RepID=A0A8S1MHV4_9CILI|nr:unnamed protein product [Paramecium sonneborni]
MSTVQKELDNSNCNGRGLYFDQICHCDLGYFGVQCTLKLQEIHVISYFTFIGLFLILFMLLLFFTVKQLQFSLNTNQIPSFQRGLSYLKKILSSPLNCILCLTILFNVLKILWLSLDPLKPFDGDKIVYERILAEIVYTILFYIYGILLMVWYTMYDEISFNISERNNNSKSQSVFSDELKFETRKWIFVYYKDIMKIRLFFVFLLQLAISILNGNMRIQLGLRLSQKYKTILYIAFVILLFNFISFILEFFLYGKSLNECIKSQLRRLDKDSKVNDKEDQDKIVQVNQQQQVKKLKILKIVFSKTSHEIQQEEKPQSPNIYDQQVLRLSSQSGSEENNEQIQTTRAIVSIEKLNLSYFKKSVSFKNINQEIQVQQKNVKEPQSLQDFEIKKELDQYNLKTIVSDESLSSKEEAVYHQKVNSCLLNEDDNPQENIKWNIDLNRQNILQVKKMQIKVVEKTKQQVNETKKYKKANLKNNNKEILFHNQQNDVRKAQVYSGEDYESEIQIQEKQFKSANLNADKKVIRKIQLLIYAGVFLEICFGALLIVILLTDLLKTPEGTLCYLYISTMLQYLSLITVLKLFRDVRSQEVLNLIWIQKVGNRNNKINQKYFFTFPRQQTKMDDSKKKFEKRINMHIK